ncbi:hypothetical protein PC117_g3071 [Phytophthora cactorum]|uniref:Uncharacterized protein n=1 Tax=Phytophthora cactorum TaxID=29920 RepID=A0A8T1EJS3_9STRA|nr:hypothetical protein PC117_g3071 [Phytophthora cactorum]
MTRQRWSVDDAGLLQLWRGFSRSLLRVRSAPISNGREQQGYSAELGWHGLQAPTPR